MLTTTTLYVLVLSILFAALSHSQESNDVFIRSTREGAHIPSRTLLLTAHPDDECFFFAPTVLALAAHSRRHDATDHELFSLTLSTGNADGLGDVRGRELQGSLEVLGIAPERWWVVDHADLQDNITLEWNPETIANVVRPYVLKYGITTILTFDHEGISSHPNHKALPDGVKHLIHTHNATSPSPPPRLFSLISTPITTKYNGILSPLLAKFDLYTNRALYYLEIAFVHVLEMLGVPITSEPGKSNYAADRPHFIMPVFVSGFQEYWQAAKAIRAHQSQLVWFRYLYILFSRYMWVNDRECPLQTLAVARSRVQTKTVHPTSQPTHAFALLVWPENISHTMAGFDGGGYPIAYNSPT
ncbi:hypothetical protein AX17_004670 [Amanita inopinata Kibby_2008]|nr:hypothetical protein AX17_004670 [Amanita inopinata Kibby_2008]